MSKTIEQIVKELEHSLAFTKREVVDIITYAYNQGKESTLIEIKDDPKFEECFDEKQ